MSKVLYAYSRTGRFNESIKENLLYLCNELTPDNVSNAPDHRICVKDHVAYAVTMTNYNLQEWRDSLVVGLLYNHTGTSWAIPKQMAPDGNYALFRNGDDEIEVVSDSAGSRTVWYYHDEELFLASTSQRAIILFLGSLQFDERVIPWMLSTGSLGPCLSWDRRLKRLQADSAVLLNKTSWRLSVTQNPIVFAEAKRSTEEHKELLSDSIRRTVRSLTAIDFKHWALPLSGGYDSRAILCFIKEQVGLPSELRTVTWGLRAAANEDGNDAKVAKELARALGVQHDYYHTDVPSEPVASIIDRFILCAEGRVDHLAGYMDGMEIWKRLHSSGIYGVIRGDEGFGWSRVSSELTVKLSIGCALCTDFSNLKKLCEECEIPSQELPREFRKATKESFSGWRDRLYHAYRIPTILAALSDIKLSYIEQINPLLSRAVLTAVRSIPDNLRTDKALFREIVDSMAPNIPMAYKGANATSEDILRKKAIIELLKSEISSSYASQLFGAKFVARVCDGIEGDMPRARVGPWQLAEIARSRVPRFAKNWLRDNALRPKVDHNVLAFRVLILLKMHKTLGADAMKLVR